MATKEEAQKQVQFGVFQQEGGSYAAGEFRFPPLAAVPVPAEAAKQLDTEVAPVKFFPSADKAAEEVSRLRDKFARKPKV